MKRVLIGYDGSHCAEAAMEDLSRSGLPEELEAMVISVADVWLPTNPLPGEKEFPEPEMTAVRRGREQALQAVESARAAAQRASERLHSLFPKWKIESFACGDSPSWAILSKAAEWKANLIVLGSHGRSTLERFFLGSVSQKVAAEAVCSVRIARPRLKSQHNRLRAVIAVDGSPDSQAAVDAVARRVWPEYCEFHVVAVIDPRMESTFAWPGVYRVNWERQGQEETRDAIGRILEADARKLYDTGLLVETHVLMGDPKRELLAHAERWEADSIFIGARGLHHGGRLSLGTMASAVTARAHCSVEIIRP
jgi:nucleotide-binding universal stress UspA family protein